VAGPTFEIVHRNLDASGTASQQVAQLAVVPRDKILVLSNFVAIAAPGLTQAVVNMRLSGFTQAGQEFNIARLIFPETTDLNETLNWDGEIYLHGRVDDGINIQILATFDAGVASNLIATSLSGIVIPRGNAANF